MALIRLSLIIISLLFFYSNTHATQMEDSVFVIDYTMLASKVEYHVDMDWKFKPGDSLDWGLPDYDDSEWVNSNTSFGEKEYEELLKKGWNGIGWFRKKIVVDSSLADINLAVTVYQRAATEIYIDGKLWRQFGRVSSNPDQERLYRNRSYYFSPFEMGKTHLVAVRVSNHKMYNFIKNNNYGGFSLLFSGFERMLEADRNMLLQARTHTTIIITFTASFFLLHFLMFVFYRKNVTNLYYSLAVGFLSLAVYSRAVMIFTNNPEDIILYGHLAVIFQVLFHVLILRMIYTLFSKKVTVFFYLILSAYLLLTTYSIITYSTNNIVLSLIDTFTYILIVSVIVSKSPTDSEITSSWIISTGVIVTVVIITLINLHSFNLLPFKLNMVYTVEYYSVFPLMLSMSVFQARDLAKKNDILEFRMNKIKQLSDENLKQTRRELDLRIESEKQKVLFQEAEYRAKVAELQANAIVLENERKTQELEEARNLQLSMLPKRIPNHPCYSIAAKMITATEVGGDYYDFVSLDTQKLLFAIGDATGHGLSAGTMVTAVKSLFRHVSSNPSQRLPDILNNMSRTIKQMNFKKLFMSLTVARLTPDSVTLSAAGMPGVLFYSASEKKVTEYLIKGMPVGSVQQFPYDEIEFNIHSGDALLFYSDGISELFNEKREHFDTHRIQRIFEQFGYTNPDEVIHKLIHEAENWRGNTPQHDDITLVVVKRK